MDLGPLRILIVDDNRQSTEIIKTILTGAGAREVRTAAATHEGYAILLEEAIDLVILDQNLGRGGEGHELARRIRNDPTSPTPYVPILMLTGYADMRRVRAARDAGVSEFLVKPFTVAGLLRRIEALIFQPRNFVRSENYFGPDRRRRVDRNYSGVERRKR